LTRGGRLTSYSWFESPSEPRPPETTLKIVLPPSFDQFITAFAARRGRFALFVGSVTAIAVTVAMVLPVWFRAESTLLPPPETSDSFGSLAGVIQSSALGSLGLVTTSSTSDVFVEILKSRTLHEAAAARFKLAAVYGTKGLDRTLLVMRKHLSVDAGRSGVILLAFEDRSAARAAEVANFLVSELDRFNREIYSTRAKRTRQFLEARLEDTQARLADSQARLSQYERTNKVLTSSEQAAVSGAASVMAQKMNLQIKRSYLSEYLDPKSPAVRELDAQIEAVEREIGRVPGLKMAGARLALEVELQTKLFSLLSAQYEEARIQETRDTPTVTVLDAARAPEIKWRPRRSMIVVMSVAAALAMCALYTLFGLRTSQTP
jgi:uncharacterized protein involved in exopolysaccharide biosynthesis